MTSCAAGQFNFARLDFAGAFCCSSSASHESSMMELAKYFISRAEGNGFPNSSRLKAVNGHCLSIDGKDWFCCPAEWIRNLIGDGFPNTSLLLAVNGSKNSRVLVGCLHSSHHQSFPREWIRKSFPVDREGLTVLNPILPRK